MTCVVILAHTLGVENITGIIMKIIWCGCFNSYTDACNNMLTGRCTEEATHFVYFIDPNNNPTTRAWCQKHRIHDPTFTSLSKEEFLIFKVLKE